MTDYLKTCNSLLEMILDPIKELPAHYPTAVCSPRREWQLTIIKHVARH